MARKPGKPRELYDPCKNPQHFNAKPDVAADYWELYQQGLSLQEVAEKCNSTRTSVHNLLKSHGYKLRTQKRLPSVMFNGEKYTLKTHGYYIKTTQPRSLLHRDIWEYHNDKIPCGFDVHHINHDKLDNRIENLQIMTCEEHTKHHHQPKPVRRLDTGEVYESVKIASQKIGISGATIRQSINKGCNADNSKWEYVD
ncbi:HNH endonuclease [Dolichospermum flos-aquae UHCC 0037]|uniref:HNH endonuclease n=2 Tax=Cyanophyceae TaxID=3028117 RepID=A0ACC7S184_DOLFA|nr:HNH endonuclease [Anabaena sp. 54]MTJ42258.1 HNH endonuclease [Dolichospermum flos-aquae UHCC 0037]